MPKTSRKQLASASHLDEKRKRRIENHVFNAFLADLIEQGDIDPGMSEAEIIDAVIKILKQTKFTNEILVDYTKSLLKHARRMRNERSMEFASIFYGIWIEHTVNEFIFRAARKKGFPLSDIESMIRESSIRAKTTWVLRALGGTPFSPLHIKRIGKLMEFRNSYIHYKWKPINDQSRKELETTVDQMDLTVKYLLKYGVKHLDIWRESRVKSLLREKALSKSLSSINKENLHLL